MRILDSNTIINEWPFGLPNAKDIANELRDLARDIDHGAVVVCECGQAKSFNNQDFTSQTLTVSYVRRVDQE